MGFGRRKSANLTAALVINPLLLAPLQFASGAEFQYKPPAAHILHTKGVFLLALGA